MPTEKHGSSPRSKRALDVAIAGVALVALAPAAAGVAVLVRWRLGTPVLFRQERPGLHGAPFTMHKFRTMTTAVDERGHPLPDAERLTRLGRVLRTTSLDELPELVDVLRGDMSLVGPRPLLIRYTPFLTDEEKLRFRVKPGITGWAQINGRNEASWDDRLQRDVWYVRNWSLALDVRILVMTVGAVLRRRGVAVEPWSIMADLDVERRSRLGE